MPICVCRYCTKRYDTKKTRANWRGYCSAKCEHAMAKKLCYSKSKEKKNPELSEYRILCWAKEIGDVLA